MTQDWAWNSERRPHPSVRRHCSCATSARTVWLATTRSGGVQRSGHVTGWPPWQTLTSGLRAKIPTNPVTNVASPHTLCACALYFDTDEFWPVQGRDRLLNR